jgi:hypothetical protein
MNDVTKTRAGRGVVVGLEGGAPLSQDRTVKSGDRLTTDSSVWGSFSDSRTPRIQSQPKGRTNAELMARRANAVPRGVGNATSIFADRAENAYLWDVEGRRYIDFGGGIGVLNTGHRNPKVSSTASPTSASR